MNTLQFLLNQLFIVDMRALICVVFWEGIASSLIIFTSQKYVKSLHDENLLKKSIFLRLIRSLGYFLFLYRGIFPDAISSTLANILLFTAFYLDTHVIFQETKLFSDGLKKYGRTVLIGFSLLYIAADFFIGTANIRVFVASAAVFFTFAPVVFKCMFSKHASALNRSFLWPHLALITLAIPRAIVGMMNINYTLFEADSLQGMYFVFLLLKAFFGTLFLFVSLLSDSSNEIDRMARDPLTGLNNRRTFVEQATKVFQERRRVKGYFGIFFLDIDFFKKINDTWGHDTGDEILIAAADAVQCSVDVNDICCRHGGDEFLICVAIDNISISNEIGKRIKERLRKIDMLPDFTITSSIGFAYGIPQNNECIDDYIKKADEAMYLSKHNGRDQLTILNCQMIETN